MWANNEIGTLQPMARSANWSRRRARCSCTRGAGGEGEGRRRRGAGRPARDLGHKIYGPKGVGAGTRRPKVRLVPLIDGGGHEKGLRSGIDVPAWSGWCGARFSPGSGRRSITAPRTAHSAPRAHRDPAQASTSTGRSNSACRATSTSVRRHRGRGLLPRCATSRPGSACSSASIEPSHVIRAVGAIGTLDPFRHRKVQHRGGSASPRDTSRDTPRDTSGPPRPRSGAAAELVVS
jgi:cysteine desulfurase